MSDTAILEQELDNWLAEHHSEMVEQISQLAAAQSVRTAADGKYPFGKGVAVALDIALKMAEGFGFETVNDDYYYGLAVMGGQKSRRLGIFTHLDVVPAGSGWIGEPYTPFVRDGYLIGRGVGDNKGPAVAALYALRFLKEKKIALEQTVELYFGCAEEQGMDDIAYYLTRNTPPDFSFTPDVAFPVSYGEKGILELAVSLPVSCPCLLELHGGEAQNAVAAQASAVLLDPTPQTTETLSRAEGVTLSHDGKRLNVCASGIGRHAAFPEGSVNAIALLCGALAQVEQLGTDTQDKLKTLAQSLEDYYGKSLGIPYEDDASGRLTHTCGLLGMESGVITAHYNLRYPIHTPADEMKSRLRTFFDSRGYQIIKLHDNPPAYVAKDGAEVTVLTAICNHVLKTSLTPYTMGGGTYARKLPNAVGFGPGRNDLVNPFGNGHEPNEAVRLSDLENAVKIYVMSLLALDKMA